MSLVTLIAVAVHFCCPRRSLEGRTRSRLIHTQDVLIVGLYFFNELRHDDQRSVQPILVFQVVSLGMPTKYLLFQAIQGTQPHRSKGARSKPPLPPLTTTTATVMRSIRAVRSIFVRSPAAGSERVLVGSEIANGMYHWLPYLVITIFVWVIVAVMCTPYRLRTGRHFPPPH